MSSVFWRAKRSEPCLRHSENEEEKEYINGNEAVDGKHGTFTDFSPDSCSRSAGGSDTSDPLSSTEKKTEDAELRRDGGARI